MEADNEVCSWELREKLRFENKGRNLLGELEGVSEKYYIKVYTVGSKNLLESEEKVVVEHNLPFRSYSYGWECELNQFFGHLKEWVKTPHHLFIQKRYNRRRGNEISEWDLPDFREKRVTFQEIDIQITERAKHLLKLNFDFVGEVKKQLELQRELTKEEAKDFEQYFWLLNCRKDLKRKYHSSNDSYYGYSEDRDLTISMQLSAEEYNKRLKQIEKEVKAIMKKHKGVVDFKPPSFDYIDTTPPLTEDEWIEEHRDELEENWNNGGESENYNSFDEYCSEMFECWED